MLIAAIIAVVLQASTPDTVLLSGQSNAVNLDPHLTVKHVTIAESGLQVAAWNLEQQRIWPKMEPILRSGRIKALVWWQGESDRNESTYAEQLRELMTRIRATAGNPTLPLVIVRVLDLPEFAAIRQAQEQFAANEPYTVLVSSDGDGHQLRDEAHLTLAGYREVARRIRHALRVIQVEHHDPLPPGGVGLGGGGVGNGGGVGFGGAGCPGPVMIRQSFAVTW